jgi:hypothetical protein
VFLCSYTKSCQYSIIKDGADWISNRFLDIDASGPNAKSMVIQRLWNIVHSNLDLRGWKLG